MPDLPSWYEIGEWLFGTVQTFSCPHQKRGFDLTVWVYLIYMKQIGPL